MSRQLINEYRADLDRLRAVSGSRRESVLREAFKDLLKRWGRSHDLLFVPEHAITTSQKNRIYLDGALLHALRVPFGYWEAKDVDDDLDAEIAAKTRKGYPRDNIIYSDDYTAILIQDGHEIARVAMDDTDALYPLLVRFYAHERQEIADFNKAVEAVQPRPACGARGAARPDRQEAQGVQAVRGRRKGIPPTRAGSDKPGGRRRRCAGNADPAHPD